MTLNTLDLQDFDLQPPNKHSDDKLGTYCQKVRDVLNSIPAIPYGKAHNEEWFSFAVDGVIEFNIITSEVKRYTREISPLEWTLEESNSPMRSHGFLVRVRRTLMVPTR